MHLLRLCEYVCKLELRRDLVHAHVAALDRFMGEVVTDRIVRSRPPIT